MIDWSKVEELRNKIGVDDFDEVVELFLSEVEDRIDVALTKADSESFEEGLHFLKGSALNLGFDQFAQLCGAGEQQAANGVPFDRMDEIASAYQNSKKCSWSISRRTLPHELHELVHVLQLSCLRLSHKLSSQPLHS